MQQRSEHSSFERSSFERVEERRGRVGDRILAMVTARLLAVAEAEGLDGERLLSSAKLTRTELANPDHYISIAQHTTLGDGVSRGLGGVNGGLHSGMTIYGDPKGCLGFGVRRSGLHRIAIRRFADFLAVTNHSLSTAIVEHKGGSLQFQLELAPALKRQGHPAEALFAAWVSISRFVTDQHWRPLSVCFTHGPKGPTSEHAEFFGCPVEFNASTTTLIIGEQALSREIQPTPHPLDDVLDRLELNLKKQDMAEENVNQLLGHLRAGGLVSPYKDEVLAVFAAKLLLGELPAFEVAFLLGYPGVEALQGVGVVSGQ